MEKNSSLLSKYVSGELHFWVWGVISRCMGWVNSFIIITSLSIYQYGIFQLFLTAYSALTDFISWGGLAAGTETLRFVGEGKESSAKRLFIEFNILRIVSAIALWALFFFGASFLSFRYGVDFIDLIKVMSFMFLGEAFLAALKSLVNMRLDFRSIASRSASGKFFQFGVLVWFLVYGTVGLKAVFLSLVIGHILSSFALLPAAIRAWKPWKTVSAERGRVILWQIAKAHGKWESIRNFSSQIVSRAEPWLIKFFISTEAVGIFGVASALADAVMNIVPTKTISTIITRIFHDKERSKRAFLYSVKYFVFVGVISSLGAVVVAPIAIHVFLPAYISALPFFYLLIAVVPVKALLQMVDLFLIVYRQQKFAFFRMLSRNIVILGLLLVLLPTMGLWGVAWTEIIMRVSFVYVSYKFLIKLKPEFRLTLKDLLSFTGQDRRIVKAVWANFFAFFRRASA